MEKCKSIEAKLDFLKTLFEKLTLILIGLGGGLGTLVVKYPDRHLLTVFTSAIFWVTLTVWGLIIWKWKKEVVKLNRCKEDTQ